MNITFYQVAKLFPDNSTFLGELRELDNQEVNVDVSNISRINLLLDKNYQDYNYIKVAISENEHYFYFLESWDYYNNQKLRFRYKMDIIRTLYHKDSLNHDINIVRYSNVLNMNEEQKSYFWKNQQTKLGSNQVEQYSQFYIKYSDSELAQEAWNGTKWLYIWLQPKATQTVNLSNAGTTAPFIYQYSYNKQIREAIIDVLSTDLRLTGDHWYRESPDWDRWVVGQVYHTSDTNFYYRYCEKDFYNYWSGLMHTGRFFKAISDFNYTNYQYYMTNIPSVQMGDMPNSLYCMVLPLSEIKVRRFYKDNTGVVLEKTLSWDVDNIVPYLFDVGGNNNWNDYIVDIKLSLIPPFDITSKNYTLTSASSRNTPVLVLSQYNSDFTPIKNLQFSLLSTQGTNIVDNNIYLPFIKAKPSQLVNLTSDFKFPSITMENIVFRKYYLSIVEQRKELDIPKLIVDKANTLYYYEDLHPGRTSIAFGYAPKYTNTKQIAYYLLHSPSTIFFDRDTSLPVFTTNYQTYLSNNKNFIQQAQLQRNSELTQNLISSGASVAGASAVANAVSGYSPMGSVGNAVGKSVNALINYNVQVKQFNWSLENMKSAPGNYKAASATLSFMLSLNIYDLWVEVFTSNPFDINLYTQLINDIGFEYFNFSYNFAEVINDCFSGGSSKKYLQAIITGLTSENPVNLPLINILAQQLKEGVNIFI